MACDPCPGNTKAVLTGSSFIVGVGLVSDSPKGRLISRLSRHAEGAPQQVCVDARKRPCRRSGRFLLLFLDLKNLAALVVSAIRTDGVRQAHHTAVGASHQVACRQRILRPSAIAPSLGVLAFWMWCHLLFPSHGKDGHAPVLGCDIKKEDYSGDGQ